MTAGVIPEVVEVGSMGMLQAEVKGTESVRARRG